MPDQDSTQIQDYDQDPDLQTDSGIRPETAAFLNDLACIGTPAYLAMRDPDMPQYADWRDANFTPDDSGNYVSGERQAYSDDDLSRMHSLLSSQAGNPLVSQLFAGPKSPIADYMVWRNQNYSQPNGGAWEDDDGNIYSEQGLQRIFGAKSAAGKGGSVSADEAMNERASTADGSISGLAAQFPFWQRKEVPPPEPPQPPGVPPFAFDKARINKLRVEQVAGVVFNENRDVMPGDSTAEELQAAKTAQAHAVINGDLTRGPNRPKTAPWQVPENLKNSVQYQQALSAARTAFQENNLGIDPTGGRLFFNNRFEGDKKGPRILEGVPQDPYHTYGPFTVGGGKVWTVIYDEPKKNK